MIWLRYRVWAYLMRLRPVKYLSIRTWAVWKTALTVWKYLMGIRERVRMGMTFQEASDRSYRWEVRKIEDALREAKDRLYLAKWKRQHIQKELDSVSGEHPGNV